MANLSSNVKTVFLKGLEALGKTASNLSDAASHKLTEMNLDTRRREVLAQIPKCVMQLWKDGVELPEPLTTLLEELAEVESKLAAIRPKQEKAAAPAEEPENAPAAVQTVEQTVEVAVQGDEEAEAEIEDEAADAPFQTEAPAYVCPIQESEEEPAAESADEPACECSEAAQEDASYIEVTEIADEPDAE